MTSPQQGPRVPRRTCPSRGPRVSSQSRQRPGMAVTFDRCPGQSIGWDRSQILLATCQLLRLETNLWKMFMASIHIQAYIKVPDVDPYKNGWTIEMPFQIMTSMGPKYHVLDGRLDPSRRRGNFRWLSGPFKSIENLRCSSRCSVAAALAAKGIIQSPITSRSTRNHPVCQTSANSILKISPCRRCCLSAA